MPWHNLFLADYDNAVDIKIWDVRDQAFISDAEHRHESLPLPTNNREAEDLFTNYDYPRYDIVYSRKKKKKERGRCRSDV